MDTTSLKNSFSSFSVTQQIKEIPKDLITPPQPSPHHGLIWCQGNESSLFTPSSFPLLPLDKLMSLQTWAVTF